MLSGNVPALPFLVAKPCGPASMAVLVKADERLEEERKEFSPAVIRRMERRRFVFQRRIRGESLREICKFLEQNGYPCSLQTVFDDLHSDQCQGLAEELERVQLQDIALLRALAVDVKDLKALSAAIQARGQMIKFLMPQPEKSRVDVNVNVASKTEVKVETVNLLAEYEQLITASVGVETGNLSADDSGEQVSKAQAVSKASEIPVK